MVLFTKKLVSFLLAIIAPFTTWIFGDYTGAFIPKNARKVNLTFATISDTHLTNSKIRSYTLALGLNDISKAYYPVDALVHVGDITDHGNTEQWENVLETFRKYNEVENVILAIGNHDTWTNENAQGDESRYPDALQNFIKYNKLIADRDIDKPYYSTKVKGYTFIVLGSEGDHVAATVSQAQLDWLKAEMEEASKDGKPIFVVFHQPINRSHGLPKSFGDKDYDENTGGIGEQSAQVEEILKSYQNVFYISGHLHVGFGEKLTAKTMNFKSIESDGSFHSINLPCYMYLNTTGGQAANGNGFMFEVYDDSVVVRGRSFSAGVWYTQYEYTIDLV